MYTVNVSFIWYVSTDRALPAGRQVPRNTEFEIKERATASIADTFACYNYPMWGWIAAAVTFVAIIAASANLDMMRKANSPVASELVIVHQPMQATTSGLTVASPAFKNDGDIPAKYTCDASSTAPSPPLSIRGVSSTAVSLALIVEDPDVPKQLKADGVFDHWVLFNIPATTTAMGGGESDGIPGANGAGSAAYYPPCPPKQYEPSEHRYIFDLYALDTMLDLPAGASKAQVVKAMTGHIVGQARLVGRYRRQ